VVGAARALCEYKELCGRVPLRANGYELRQ